MRLNAGANTSADVTDRVARLLGVVKSVTDPVDILDRAGRSLGVVASITATVPTNPSSNISRLIGTTQDYWLYSLKAGRAFTGVANLGNIGGQYSHCQLQNPAASGVTATIKTILVSADSATYVRIQRYDTQLTVIATGYNEQLGGAAGLASTRAGGNAAQLGTTMTLFRVTAATPLVIIPSFGFSLGAGTGIALVQDTTNSGLYVHFEWVEE